MTPLSNLTFPLKGNTCWPSLATAIRKYLSPSARARCCWSVQYLHLELSAPAWPVYGGQRIQIGCMHWTGPERGTKMKPKIRSQHNGSKFRLRSAVHGFITDGNIPNCGILSVQPNVRKARRSLPLVAAAPIDYVPARVSLNWRRNEFRDWDAYSTHFALVILQQPSFLTETFFQMVLKQDARI